MQYTIPKVPLVGCSGIRYFAFGLVKHQTKVSKHPLRSTLVVMWYVFVQQIIIIVSSTHPALLFLVRVAR